MPNTAHHLRHEGGGHPARPPLPEEANPSPGPNTGRDFPDEPRSAPPGASEQDQDQPDLDAFARRLGLDTDPPTDARSRTAPLRRAVAGGLDLLATGLRRLAIALRPAEAAPRDQRRSAS